jgi:hypothetical protein
MIWTPMAIRMNEERRVTMVVPVGPRNFTSFPALPSTWYEPGNKDGTEYVPAI